ncbi:TPA: fimbrial protein [Kluyvera ascorbata]|uniref:Fimbrial protein n=1 Tax=Kluyvera genomosp. 2 TaxID=2774054 RepID=A0A2T2XXC7_9ENTR|nr:MULTISPECIES: chaperone-usher fimbrial major subunit [Enterobacteriaceae]HAT3920460.1 fimbrial protein [Kluyvera ascorbata]PSR44868.1 fimbrial protein [Kluyvera genomosp. 2]BBQ86286.1 fimbrial protein [Klebsiella sp. WP3-W18-ESBL-02]BBR23266.1 fimbrial protein [Klebsiella sp. WP3-S18-ESBL-05]HAT3945369.1 fimbrial protein [Kluyvera ascorbata]
MKGKLTAISLALSSVFFLGHAMASDGTVHFRGEVIDSTCEVTSDTKDQNVDLGKVNRTAFTGAGSTAAPMAFDIKLKSCPDTYTKAAVRFDGTEDASGNGDLAIGNPLNTSNPGDYTGTEPAPVTATGVAIRIYNKADNSQVKLYEKSAETPIVSGKAAMPFIARYVATAASVTAGTANADSQFTVEYVK